MKKAIKYYEKAASYGHPAANFNLGLIYEYGKVKLKKKKYLKN